MIEVAPHPLLELDWFVTEFPRAIGGMKSPAWLCELLLVDAAAPLAPDEGLRGAVRDLLRHGGFRPVGRSKPASEYLVRAAVELGLPSMNLPVDLCNAVSLHSGLPVSVLDHDRLAPPLRVSIAPFGQSYVFNAAGQVIDIGKLICLFDQGGPCATAVKDAQRSKTTAETRRTLSLVWGTKAVPGRTAATMAWYREVAARAGGRVE